MSLKQLKYNVAPGYLQHTTSGILMRTRGSLAGIINIANKSTLTFNKNRKYNCATALKNIGCFFHPGNPFIREILIFSSGISRQFYIALCSQEYQCTVYQLFLYCYICSVILFQDDIDIIDAVCIYDKRGCS